MGAEVNLFLCFGLRLNFLLNLFTQALSMHPRAAKIVSILQKHQPGRRVTRPVGSVYMDAFRAILGLSA